MLVSSGTKLHIAINRDERGGNHKQHDGDQAAPKRDLTQSTRKGSSPREWR